MKKAVRRGNQVLVSPHIAGPAGGRLGFASGTVIEGHCEILDRPPGSARVNVIGYFEPEDLYSAAVPRRSA